MTPLEALVARSELDRKHAYRQQVTAGRCCADIVTQ
jgi:hypothetical protein